jgi:hypothetical protein
MNRLPFQRRGIFSSGSSDAAIIVGNNVHEELVEAIIQNIETEIEITLGDKTIHLAAIRDPEHWSEDWEAIGVEDPYEFLVGLVEAR